MQNSNDFSFTSFILNINWVLPQLTLFSEGYDHKKYVLNCYRLLIYMAVIDTLLIITCVTEFSIFNIFWGDWPQWFIIAFPYWLHPLKVSKHAKLTQTFLYRVFKKVWYIFTQMSKKARWKKLTQNRIMVFTQPTQINPKKSKVNPNYTQNNPEATQILSKITQSQPKLYPK